jgi:hypothetical protein
MSFDNRMNSEIDNSEQNSEQNGNDYLHVDKLIEIIEYYQNIIRNLTEENYRLNSMLNKHRTND